jgi:hypothetical protein
VLARVLLERVTRTTEHAHRVVTPQHQVAVFDADVEHVTLTDAECVSKVGGEHDAPE